VGIYWVNLIAETVGVTLYKHAAFVLNQLISLSIFFPVFN
jgi:hypothetical protein